MIYLITSEHCSPCKQIKEWMKKNINATCIDSCIEMINIDDETTPQGQRDMVINNGIKSVPCLLHFDNGKIKKHFGFNPIKDALIEFERACDDNQ